MLSLVVLLVCKQANRALRQATLGTLNSLIVAYGDKIVLFAYEVIIIELSGLIRFVLLIYSLYIGIGDMECLTPFSFDACVSVILTCI